MTIPLAVVGGLVPAAVDILGAYRVGGFQTALEHVSLVTTGYDPSDGKVKLDFAFKRFYGPLLLGAIVHKLAGKVGVNRALSRAGVPFVRI